jgi:hypothetical protein
VKEGAVTKKRVMKAFGALGSAAALSLLCLVSAGAAYRAQLAVTADDGAYLARGYVLRR